MPSQLSAYQQLFKNFLQLLAILIAVILILGLYDTARTACLRRWGEGMFKAIISGGQKNPQRQALRGCVLIFYLSDISLADFSPLCISKSNTSGIRLDAVRVPMR